MSTTLITDTAKASKKDLVMGFYHQGKDPAMILDAMNKIKVSTTLASIKWWINDFLKGGVKREAKAKIQSIIPGDAPKKYVRDFENFTLTLDEYKFLYRLHYMADEHSLYFWADVNKFADEGDEKVIKSLIHRNCLVHSDGTTKVKMSQLGWDKLTHPTKEISDALRKEKDTLPRLQSSNNNQSSLKNKTMSETKAAPKKVAKKTATKAAAKNGKAAVSKKDLVAKFMKEGKGKFTAKEILEKMEKAGASSTLASVRWYMADINANG